MSRDVFVFRMALFTDTPPLTAKLDRLAAVGDSGWSNVIVTLTKLAEPTALRIFGGMREPESGKALISASVNESFVLKTKRSTNIPASRVPILKIKGLPEASSACV